MKSDFNNLNYSTCIVYVKNISNIMSILFLFPTEDLIRPKMYNMATVSLCDFYLT